MFKLFLLCIFVSFVAIDTSFFLMNKYEIQEIFSHKNPQ